MKVKEREIGSCAQRIAPYAILLRHIGDGSNHGGNRRDAGTDAQQLSRTCTAQDLAGYDDLAAWLNLAF